MEKRIPIKNIYFLLCYAWDRLKEKEIISVDNIESNDLLDLLARVMISGLNYLIKRGFDRKYLCVNEDVNLVKGKVNFNDSMKRATWLKGKLSCEFDDLSYNVLHNQILKVTVNQLILHKELNEELRDNLVSLYKFFRDVDDIKLTKRIFKQVQLNRNNHYYGFLLDVCEIIFDNMLIDERHGRSKFRDFDRDEKQMAYLYENFIRNFYRRELKRYKVYRENITWDVSGGNEAFYEYLPQMQTDISVESDTRKIIIDTKYYRDAFTYYMDSKKLNSNNLYQLFAYLKNGEAKGGLNLGAEGMLLYPMVDQQIDYDYFIQGHKVKIRTIDLNQEWKLIHKRLLDIIVG